MHFYESALYFVIENLTKKILSGSQNFEKSRVLTWSETSKYMSISYHRYRYIYTILKNSLIGKLALLLLFTQSQAECSSWFCCLQVFFMAIVNPFRTNATSASWTWPWQTTSCFPNFSKQNGFCTDCPSSCRSLPCCRSQGIRIVEPKVGEVGTILGEWLAVYMRKYFFL